MASKQRQIERWSKLTQPYPDTLSCVICDTTSSFNSFRKFFANDIFCAGKIIRHQCPNCGLIFGDLRFLSLSEEEIANDYADTYSYFSEGNTLPYYLDCIKTLQIFRNKNWKYLDYACGTGQLSSFLKFKGYNIVGYDKYVIGPNTLNTIDSNFKFDVVISTNFIEHLVNPIEQIKQILELLNKNGFLIFISDCLDEYAVEYTHFHTYYYTGTSFKLLCDKLNLAIINSKTVGPCKIKVLQKR